MSLGLLSGFPQEKIAVNGQGVLNLSSRAFWYRAFWYDEYLGI
jgi:hypothetical protein